MTGKTLFTIAGAGLAVTCLTLVAVTAQALGGCVDSPENPTWILAGIGAAAAGLPWLRSKIREYRRRK